MDLDAKIQHKDYNIQHMNEKFIKWIDALNINEFVSKVFISSVFPLAG